MSIFTEDLKKMIRPKDRMQLFLTKIQKSIENRDTLNLEEFEDHYGQFFPYNKPVYRTFKIYMPLLKSLIENYNNSSQTNLIIKRFLKALNILQMDFSDIVTLGDKQELAQKYNAPELFVKICHVLAIEEDTLQRFKKKVDEFVNGGYNEELQIEKFDNKGIHELALKIYNNAHSDQIENNQNSLKNIFCVNKKFKHEIESVFSALETEINFIPKYINQLETSLNELNKNISQCTPTEFNNYYKELFENSLKRIDSDYKVYLGEGFRLYLEYNCLFNPVIAILKSLNNSMQYEIFKNNNGKISIIFSKSNEEPKPIRISDFFYPDENNTTAIELKKIKKTYGACEPLKENFRFELTNQTKTPLFTLFPPYIKQLLDTLVKSSIEYKANKIDIEIIFDTLNNLLDITYYDNQTQIGDKQLSEIFSNKFFNGPLGLETSHVPSYVYRMSKNSAFWVELKQGDQSDDYHSNPNELDCEYIVKKLNDKNGILYNFIFQSEYK